MRPRIRFEVLKRDDFTCVYCGRRAPDVELEVDHIHPLAEGGTDEYENLTTACVDCNRGKSARLLDTVAPVRDLEAETQALLERQEKLRNFHKVRTDEEQRIDAVVAAVYARWDDFWCGMRDYRPYENSLRKAAETLPLEELLDAVDIALIQLDRYHGYDTCRYFGGVLKRKVAEAEGRVVECLYCHKRMVLDPGEDTSLRWYHTACEPATETAS